MTKNTTAANIVPPIVKPLASSTPAAVTPTTQIRKRLAEEFDKIEGEEIDTSELGNKWHIHAYTEEMAKKFFSPSTCTDLRGKLLDSVNGMVKSENNAVKIPKDTGSHSLVYDYG